MKYPNWPKELTAGLEMKDKEYRLNIMHDALNILGNPHLKLNNVIHVGGTNGKGSTVNFIRTILEESGYKVNMYTSPHLIQFNERFYVKGRYLNDNELQSIINEVASILNYRTDISYFEASTLFALHAFAKSNADFNLIEVGLGGRLDATNIFEKTLCSILTSISLDHMDILGDTITQIAHDKSHIIKQNGVVFSAKQSAEAEDEITQMINKKNATLYSENQDWLCNSTIGYKSKNNQHFYNLSDHIPVKLGLDGEHQFQNAGIAISVTQYIQSLGYNKISKASILDGLQKTQWPARMQTISIPNIKNTHCILDGAHNIAGIEALCYYINNTKHLFKKNIAIFTCLSNRNYTELLDEITKVFDQVILFDANKCNIDSPKPFQNANKMLQYCQESYKNTSFNIASSMEGIYNIIDDNKDTRIIFCGSLYFGGFVLSQYKYLHYI